MNFSQKLGIFCLILISVIYVYFSYFNGEMPDFNRPNKNTVNENPIVNPSENPENPQEVKKSEIKNIKIYITDSNGNLRSVNRKCEVSAHKSCFEYAMRELIAGPTKWEKSKGLSSEIPAETRILSIREGSNNVLIDLSSAFESGGGAESTYMRVRQIIKTAKANTNLPVYLYINGKQADVIGGEGIMIKQPLDERSLNG